MRQTAFIDPGELATIADLELLARTVVAGLKSGVHSGTRTGATAEFAQYRPYAQGDDPRFVDWRLYGRSDRLHIRQFREETNLHLTLLLDISASMDYGSGAVAKFAYARMLAAALAVLAHGQRDHVGLAAYHDQLAVHIPARSRADQLAQILTALDGLQPAGATDAGQTLHFIADALPPRGMVVLISDLLHPLDDVLAHLRSLRALRHDILVLQISDPAEQTFPFDRALTLSDAEDGAERFVVPADVRDLYLANRRLHFDRVRAECLAAEIDIEEFTCDQPLDRALHRFLHRRNRALAATGLGRRASAR